MTLRTVAKGHANLRRISLETHWEFLGFNVDGDRPNLGSVIGEASRQGWSELDRALIQLSESQSICPRIVFNVPTESIHGRRAGFWLESLLSEAMARGIINLVEQSDEE